MYYKQKHGKQSSYCRIPKDGANMDDNLVRLFETNLWKAYLHRKPTDERKTWIKSVYSNAINYLKEIPNTFPNYTLHDETHVVNVMNAMTGLLGDQIDMLSTGECELLILAAALHDIGMVYTINDVKEVAEQNRFEKFIRDRAPECFGIPFDMLPDTKKQDYLRYLHPFRLPEILNSEIWGFANKPSKIVKKDVIIAVCQSHGENQDRLESNKLLEYLEPPQDVDPLFCAILLRLGDILDFDGSRAPEVLFAFAKGVKRSEEAYKKHTASDGFSYPLSPSNCELSYCAECDDPNINIKLYEYLDWVDQELLLAKRLKNYCRKEWQRSFPLPRAVSRKQITTVNFDSAPFSVIMDQERILELLTGEKLYDSRAVFIRELLQNAIDATLLREKMDPHFSAEDDEAAIYLWSGLNNAGRLIFRIDDHGTGMTRGMLYRYFLRVGKSYYVSQELMRDLLVHKCKDDYHAIGQFGIGFLSCFLCGNSIEVSTLYFDEKKCTEENDYNGDEDNGFGLRIMIPGLTGHYALHNQALHHQVNTELPFPNGLEKELLKGLENAGYRRRCGTSIVVELDPGKLGMTDLKAETERWLCATRMPVYFNGERVGRTYREMKTEAQNLDGTVYELNDIDKQTIDSYFPKARGHYPKLRLSVQLSDYSKLNNFSALVWRCEPFFDSPVEWEEKDQRYTLSACFDCTNNGNPVLLVSPKNKKSMKIFPYELYRNELEQQEDLNFAKELESIFDGYDACPKEPLEVDSMWKYVFSEYSLEDLWQFWVDYCAGAYQKVNLSSISIPSVNLLHGNPQNEGILVSYHGMFIDNLMHTRNNVRKIQNCVLFCLEGKMKPMVDLARSRILSLTSETELVMREFCLQSRISEHCLDIPNNSIRTLHDWRELRQSIAEWMPLRDQSHMDAYRQYLEEPMSKQNRFVNEFRVGYTKFFADYLLAALQDRYEISICYEKGQSLYFSDRRGPILDDYNVFPPFPFCSAATDVSRQWLCAEDAIYRKGVTKDHPFAVWLLHYGAVLKHEYPSQFEELIIALEDKCGQIIQKVVTDLRKELSRFRDAGLTTIIDPPELTEFDFWKAY